MIQVSIIICTRNRAESLKQTLFAMSKIDVPAGMSAELLVVDNGSSDSTCQVVNDMSLQNIRLRYVREDRPGQCYARNRGLQETDGDYIIFTDDDVRPPLNWIEGMCEPMLDGRADAVLGGVSVPPHLQRPWFDDFPDGWLVARTTDSGQRYLRENESLIGASMAFTRSVLKKVPAFDVELDPGALGFCGDSLFSDQLRIAGFRIFANFDCSVEHHFDADRLTESAVVNQARAMGRSGAYLDHHFEHSRVRLTWLKFQYMRIKLFFREAMNFLSTRKNGPDPTAWRVRYAKRMAYYSQYDKERRRPRNYDRHGLVKLHGILMDFTADQNSDRARSGL